VVVIILPFNYPLCLLCWQAAAALATGNAVIIKPSELTTLTTLQFVDAFAALPSGLVQVLAGGGKVGQRLAEHENTHMVAFTGRNRHRTYGGADLRTALQAQLDRDPSGNDPFIVMPSAPIDTAARGAAFGAYLNTAAQVCAAAERFFVHEKVYAEFVDKLVEYTRKVRVGNGLENVDMGPLASEREFAAVFGHSAAREGTGNRDRRRRRTSRESEQGVGLSIRRYWWTCRPTPIS